MVKKVRDVIKKSRTELLGDLVEQISHLLTYCTAYDLGQLSMAKPISVGLAILLYGDQGKSLSLLHQLGLRQRRFLDTAPALPSKSTYPLCQLAVILVEEQKQTASYVPLLSDVPNPPVKSEFPEWWTKPVVRDIRGRTFSRLELVKEVRDTDGGAHLDAALGETYADFKSGRYMGWQIEVDEKKSPISHPHLACMRQIAHETLLTLREAAPGQFNAEYVFDANPLANRPGVLLYGNGMVGPPGSSVTAIQFGDMKLIGEV
jgi:hypothetical protein